jgi:uncharacterized protein (DUF1015 family)
LELLRHTLCHTGQLFMLYSDPARRVDALLDQVARVPPPIEVRDDFGVLHRLWPVLDPEIIERFRREMAGQKLVIADGHHRYETALAYRNECRASLGRTDPGAPHEKVMMTFVNTHTEGLVILPTHRLVSGLADFRFASLREQLAPYFDWYSYPFGKDSERAANLREFRADLARRGRERHALGAYAKGGALSLLLLRQDADPAQLLPDLTPAQRELDVVLLHRLILERTLGITAEAVRKGQHVDYEREMEAAVTTVDRGTAQVCFLLNPVSVERVAEMALAGEVLPQKSTDFYPKLLSGLTIYRLNG